MQMPMALVSDSLLSNVCRFILHPSQEMQREHNNLSSQLQQGTKRLNQLEEEQKINEQSLKQSRNMVEDLKGRNYLSESDCMSNCHCQKSIIA